MIQTFVEDLAGLVPELFILLHSSIPFALSAVAKV
jgi:hypothetical protein